jgi:hypothetical protein
MKKNYLTLVLLLTVLAAPALKSFAMVPPPESLRTWKHHEQTKPADPNTTVIVSGKVAIMVPTHPTKVAIMVPTHPTKVAIMVPTHPTKVAIMVPTHPTKVAIMVPTHPTRA